MDKRKYLNSVEDFSKPASSFCFFSRPVRRCAQASCHSVFAILAKAVISAIISAGASSALRISSTSTRLGVCFEPSMLLIFVCDMLQRLASQA